MWSMPNMDCIEASQEDAIATLLSGVERDYKIFNSLSTVSRDARFMIIL